MSEDFSSDILWGVARIGEAAAVYHKDGTVNTKVTSDRLCRPSALVGQNGLIA